MQYDPRLKRVSEQILHILKENNIAAYVVLHSPGFSELIINVGTSYSCAKINDGGVGIKADLEKDFGGNKEEWAAKVRDTADMLHHLSGEHIEKLLTLHELSQALDAEVKITYEKGDSTSHTTQNN